MKCCRMLLPVLYSLLMALPGCNHGDKNRDPIAANYTATTARQVPVTIKVLANDSDPDGDQLEVVDITQGANGEVVLNDDGTATYTPREGFDGTDSFTYTIDDDHGGQATGINNNGLVSGVFSQPASDEEPEPLMVARPLVSITTDW